MKLFRIEATEYDYDDYDSFIVCAKKKEDVLELIREEFANYHYDVIHNFHEHSIITEVTPNKLGIVMSSFNAG